MYFHIMLSVSHLYVYPIKSLGGILLDEVELTDRGLKNDRRFVLIDDNNRFISQRELAKMALLHTVICGNQLIVFEKGDSASLLQLDLYPSEGDRVDVILFDDASEGLLMNGPINDWFSKKLDRNCRLVYMPDKVERKVDPIYARHQEIAAFSDGFPVLMIGQSSLNDLNNRLDQWLPMNRFRPNIVFSGGAAFEEDTMKEVVINSVSFSAVKPCARCVVTTIDQETGLKGKEPLRTLNKYRQLNNKLYFGQNILYKGEGILRIGDELKVMQRQPYLF
ncbi:MOSC domain-containing protein [Niabella hibiscisoli]|uniref:MOSC domain-containing protein n=1 Tax=Niabella hibiscisoli TaxID=1825928 RepID=UPI001F0EA4F8|nr:MOSC N-terminal beta barrel domain-containing protein [Niabella hibiscisoli]MCH5717667.1 MOSC domain-containing protein [Niabella hibiscisoli]